MDTFCDEVDSLSRIWELERVTASLRCKKNVLHLFFRFGK
jgi:hypothetical protein